jgi:NAD(P)-dependent dehydrogenase (short-subunit alcohol dehydrogenase family)
MLSPMLPILITGVGRQGQVGEAVALELATRGAPLLLVDRDAAEAEGRAGALRALGHRATAFAADLSDPTSVDALAAGLHVAAKGRLGGVVHLAGGFAMSGPVAESDPAVWHRMMMINLTTAMLATRVTLPMLRPGGAAVYLGSVAALPGGHGAAMSAYVAAKAGVLALMRAVAEEEREHGVRANALAPSAIRTAANLAAMPDGTRYVEREEVAGVIAWLLSEESAGVSGQVLEL